MARQSVSRFGENDLRLSPARPRTSRPGYRELFLWTAAIGVLLGLARWAVTQESSRAGGVSRGEIIFSGLLLASNAGLALAATAATLVPRFWTLCLPAMILLCAGFAWAAWRLYNQLFGQDDAHHQ